MKYLLVLTLAIFLLSCGDNTEISNESSCKAGSFYHESGNCVNPCDNIDCGDGECKGISAVQYECTKPNCLSPEIYQTSTNTCVAPCDTVNCGDGECVVLSETQTECKPAVCDTGFFANEANVCVNPCENVDCGIGLSCQSVDADTFLCVQDCSENPNFFEHQGQCVNPCENVDCGLGNTTCVPESALSFHCECDADHELLNGKCRKPFRKLYKPYVEGEDNRVEAIAFHALSLPAEGFRNDAPEGHTPHYNGYDMVFNEGEGQFIEGNFEYGDFRLNVQDEDVAIYVWSYTDENPSWKHLADVKTCDNDQNLYGPDDFCVAESKGGMIHYDLPEHQTLPVGLHLIKLFVKGDGVSTSMYLRIKPASEQLKMVAFDMDGTLTTDNAEVTLSYINELWNGDRDMKMYPMAPEIATYYYQRGYEIIYVTARPYWMSEMSYKWLVDKNFPLGLMHTYEGAIPDGNFDAETYKKAYFGSLVSKGVYFSYMYGNALTDIVAYKHVGTTCNRIFIIGEHAGKECSVAVESYPYHLTVLPE